MERGERMKRLMIILLIASLTQTIAVGQKKNGGQKKTADQKKAEIPKVPAPVSLDTAAPGAAQPDSQSLANAKWFEVFKDEKLQELIREALANNYDVREA